MARGLTWLAARKGRAYYAYLVIGALLLLVLASLLANGHGIVQASPRLTRQAHLSPLFVTHDHGKAGNHSHTWLGDLAFGRSLHYQHCRKQTVVDGVLHVNGRHVVDIRRYGGNYIEAVCIHD